MIIDTKHKLIVFTEPITIKELIDNVKKYIPEEELNDFKLNTIVDDSFAEQEYHSIPISIGGEC